MLTRIILKCCYGVLAGLSLFFSLASHANVVNIPLGHVSGQTRVNAGLGLFAETFDLDVDEWYYKNSIAIVAIGEPYPNLYVDAHSPTPVFQSLMTQTGVYANMEYFWTVTGPKQPVGAPAY